MQFKSAFKTDPGLVRSNNEDSVLVDANIGLFGIADGMGGHKSGEVASRLAVQVVHENMLKATASKNSMPLMGKPDPALSNYANQLASAVRLANQIIFEMSKNSSQNHGMGTTFSAVLLHGDSLSLTHVGDSRVYLFRQGELIPLTTDHTIVEEQKRRGLINEEQAKTSPMQHVLTRALGAEETIQVDVEEHPLFIGDKLLLCTDGLTKPIGEEEIRAVLAETDSSEAACATLVEKAKSAGGPDNVSVVAVFIEQVESKKTGLSNMVSGLFKRLVQATLNSCRVG